MLCFQFDGGSLKRVNVNVRFVSPVQNLCVAVPLVQVPTCLRADSFLFHQRSLSPSFFSVSLSSVKLSSPGPCRAHSQVCKGGIEAFYSLGDSFKKKTPRTETRPKSSKYSGNKYKTFVIHVNSTYGREKKKIMSNGKYELKF